MSKKLKNTSKNIDLIEIVINKHLQELNSDECILSLDKRAYILSNLTLRQIDIEELKGNIVDYKPKIEEGEDAIVEFEKDINKTEDQKNIINKDKKNNVGKRIKISSIENIIGKAKQKN
jgi:hypothetical protein